MVSIAPGVVVQVAPPSRPAVVVAPPAVVQVQVTPAGGPASLAVQVAPPRHPTVMMAPPAASAVQVAPIIGPRGPTGKDGADLTPDQISTIAARVTAALPASTYLHVQNSAVQDWPITHPLTQPVAAVHVVTSGEDVLVPWVELPDRTVIVSFGAPASGTATLT